MTYLKLVETVGFLAWMFAAKWCIKRKSRSQCMDLPCAFITRVVLFPQKLLGNGNVSLPGTNSEVHRLSSVVCEQHSQRAKAALSRPGLGGFFKSTWKAKNREGLKDKHVGLFERITLQSLSWYIPTKEFVLYYMSSLSGVHYHVVW